jgi:Tol biopolymer transport system component
MKASRILVAAVLAGLLEPLTMASPDPGPRYSDWSAPTNLGPVVNSPFTEGASAVSKNGLSLFFASGRAGGFGAQDLWVSHRGSQDAAWEPPTNLGAVINTAYVDGVPALSRDEHWLFFVSDRPGGLGGADIWAAYREHTKDDLGWQPPVNLGPAINTEFLDAGPAYFEDDSGAAFLLFASDRPGGSGSMDIYEGRIFSDGSAGPAVPVPELNSPDFESRPSVRFDGLEVFFFSDRPGGFGGADLWVAKRETVFDRWSTPVNLGSAINGSADDQQPYIAADRETLYFASNRPGGSGRLDLYVSTRSRTGP